jgi:hypothetical protein
MTKRLLVAAAAALAIVAPSVLTRAHVDVVPTSRVTDQVAAGEVKQMESKLPSYRLLTH